MKLRLCLLFFVATALQGAVLSAAESSAAPPEAPPTRTMAPLITTDLGGRDLEVLRDVLRMGRLQAVLGKLAAERAESAEVRAIGEALQSTQLDENKLLQALARRQGLRGQENPAGSAEEKKVVAALEKKKGVQFDKAIMTQIVEAVEESVATYERAQASETPAIQRFAAEILPLARGKLQVASKVAGIPRQTTTGPKLRGEVPGEVR